jgi:hypothetical protein
MDSIDIFSLIIPITLIHFAIDYLSDKNITHSETKAGIMQMIHHLFVTIQIFGIIPFKKRFSFLIISILTSLVIQCGYLINNDYCWLTKAFNNLINPDQPNRIWRADLPLQIKHYILGDDWGYKDIYKVDQSKIVIISNVSYLFQLITISVALWSIK